MQISQLRTMGYHRRRYCEEFKRVAVKLLTSTPVSKCVTTNPCIQSITFKKETPRTRRRASSATTSGITATIM